MKNILLVDDDVNIRRLAKLKLEGVKEKYTLFTAENGEQAVEILQNKHMDYVLTDLNMPQMDGLELLNYITKYHPSVPVAVMTGKDAQEYKKALIDPGLLNILNKSETLLKLTRHVEESLSQAHQQGAVNGISLANFLQLLEMEQKTYLLEIENKTGEKGFLFISRGEPIDAVSGDLRGEQAALKMISWDQVEIRFRNIPSHKIKKRIKRGLMSLILEGVRLKDEKDHPREHLRPAADFLDDHRAGEEIFPGLEDELSDTTLKKIPGSEAGDARPYISQTAPVPREPAPKLNTSQIIQGLTGVKGVKAIFLVGENGEIVQSAGVWRGSDMGNIGASIAAVNAGAQRLSSAIKLDAFSTMTFEYDGATFMCLPVDDSLLVILSPNSNTLGIIRQKVKQNILRL